MSVLTNSNLLPFRQYAESDVLQLWSADFTGQAGTLVTIQPTNQTPEQTMGALTSASPAASFTNVGNYRFNNPRKVRPSAADDNRGKIVGITLHTVALTDENGNPLVTQPYDKTLERGFVQTGFTVPILTRGVVTLKAAQVNGNPNPGDFGIAGAGGTITPVTNTAANANLYIPSGLVVGKFISSSGTAFGGYFQFKLEL